MKLARSIFCGTETRRKTHVHVTRRSSQVLPYRTICDRTIPYLAAAPSAGPPPETLVNISITYNSPSIAPLPSPFPSHSPPPTMMDLYFSPREKCIATWIMLAWISVRSGTFIVNYVRRSVRKAEARRHRRRRSLRAMPPQNWSVGLSGQ